MISTLNGVKMFEKDGYFCMCPGAVDPGDPDSSITQDEDKAWRWFDIEVKRC